MPKPERCSRGADGQNLSGGTYDSNLSFIQSLTEALKLVPTAALLGAGGFFVGHWLAGPLLGLPLAAMATTAVLAAEAALGIRVLGRILEGYDASAEG